MFSRRLSEGRWEAESPYGGIGMFPSFWQALLFSFGFMGGVG
jgi:hypothetical protein